jgi:hypothetical protein
MTEQIMRIQIALRAGKPVYFCTYCGYPVAPENVSWWLDSASNDFAILCPPCDQEEREKYGEPPNSGTTTEGAHPEA